MRRIDKMFLFGTILLVIGIVWIIAMQSIPVLEWALLLTGIVLGILAGFVQRWAIIRQKRGHIGRVKRTVWVVGTVVILVTFKVALNILLPTPLATTGNGICLSIIVAIGGLLLGHSLYLRLHKSRFRYIHTNIIAKDASKLIDFYKSVLHCKSINETRDLRGVRLDRLTGLNEANITGENLLLPGYGEDHPTLEIFSYDLLQEAIAPEINRPGYAHIAFEVDDVETSLADIINAGGRSVGELVTTVYPNGQEAKFVYAQDPECNIIKLQSWRQVKSGS